MPLLTEVHRSAIGRQVSQVSVQVTRRDIQKYACATEQTQQKYVCGDEAPVMFIFNLFNEIVPLVSFRDDGLAIDVHMPDLPLNRVMAGGTEIRQHRPIRAGDQLIGTRKIIDLYEKEGRSGPLIFLVRELTVETMAGEAVMNEVQTRILR
ncbi:MAG: MaoC family dehydratase N-terminal domain-containing protein [Burkholderiaceae bacterium]